MQIMPCFEIIPVIDLKGGKAVAAVGANGRAAYKPLKSALCPTGDPVDAARGYLARHPFRKLYIADLDAIEHGDFHDSALERIRDAFPDLELWVDNGLSKESACRAWQAKGLGRLILGSESQRAPGLAPQIGAILSLDFRDGRFLGPAALLDEAQSWPEEVIAMALDDVGASKGPNMALLKRLQGVAPSVAFYAAGGVRDGADLKALAQCGVRGALVATALHNGSLTASDIKGLERPYTDVDA
jgi:phosphoribosylformimino-5-aminoimidazole carboxamide ribotide isomerase